MANKLHIDGREYEVQEGQNLLQAILSLGLDLPYFCWHPAMGSVGACRQCAVKQFKDEDDKQGKLVIACMTSAEDGSRISIDDPEVSEFRAKIIEWMMVNHPHDCPVCDEGGECHLQDMTVMTGHDYREFSFPKRTYRNQDLGPFINHEMNRCIQCYRCVRFYRDYAGGRDFDVFAAHDHVYFGRQEDGPLENEFSGNLIEVCPTGVFTDKTFKDHYTRKWDLQTAPSICVQCGLGCNIIPGERYGKLRRIRNRYNGEVNGYFLCDRGRFGYGYVNSERRIREPMLRKSKDDIAESVQKDKVLEHIVRLLENSSGVVGIGSPRASLEANYTLRKLVGPENFYWGLSETDDKLTRLALEIMQRGAAHIPSLKEAQEADVVLILGEDLTNTAPRLALSLHQLVHTKASIVADKFDIPKWNDIAIREIIQHEKETMFVAAPKATKLDDVAQGTYHAAPDELARLGFTVAHALDPDAPAVADISDEIQEMANGIAQMLSEAKRPLVVCGTSCGSAALMQAAANVAWSLSRGDEQAGLIYTVPEANRIGLGLMEGKSLSDAFKAVESGAAEVVFILENDLYRRGEIRAVDAFLDKAQDIIALDILDNATNIQADITLPAAAFAETDGTWVNSEGRAQRAYQVFKPEGDISASWKWLRDIMRLNGKLPQDGWEIIDDILSDISQELPVFAPVLDSAPPADFRIVGQKIPRQTPRYSGRTAIHAAEDVNEPKPPDDPQTPLAFSMEGFEGQPPSALIPRFWAPGWNSIQSLNKFQSEISGPLSGGDPGQRLIKTIDGAQPAYFGHPPEAFTPKKDQWLLINLYHVFGSEPLSMLSPGIAQRAPKPYLALNDEDADRVQVGEGDMVVLRFNNESYSLPVKRLPSLARGVVGVPFGNSPLPVISPPVWVWLTKEEGEE